MISTYTDVHHMISVGLYASHDYLLEHTVTPVPSSLQQLMEAKVGGAPFYAITTNGLTVMKLNLRTLSIPSAFK